MASTSSSSDAWTKVGRGGRPVSFPPEAAAAFSSRGGGGSRERSNRLPSARAEFPAEAAAAFGRPPMRERPTAAYTDSAEFDSVAASAFSRPRRGGGGGFDAAAAAAFGGGGGRRGRDGEDGFPSAFGKKKSVFESAAEMGFADAESGGYGLSALARKRAEAAAARAAVPKTYDELFPALGAAAAAPQSTAAPSAAPAKRSFADIMRERAAAEEAEAARLAGEAAKEAEERRREEIERAHIRRLHVGRAIASSRNYVHYGEAEDEEGHVDYGTHDLDNDAYGARHTEIDAPLPPEPAETSEEEMDEGEYNADLY